MENENHRFLFEIIADIITAAKEYPLLKQADNRRKDFVFNSLESAWWWSSMAEEKSTCPKLIIETAEVVFRIPGSGVMAYIGSAESAAYSFFRHMEVYSQEPRICNFALRCSCHLGDALGMLYRIRDEQDKP